MGRALSDRPLMVRSWLLVPDYVNDIMACARRIQGVHGQDRLSTDKRRAKWVGEIAEVWAVEHCPELLGMTLGRFRELRAAGLGLAQIQHLGKPVMHERCDSCGHVKAVML